MPVNQAPAGDDSLRILVTNDDGIHAPGLISAERIARALSDDVWIVAPGSSNPSASHSLTLTLPLCACARGGTKRFAVTGTPTDCVMMACAHIMKDNPPALILSGVNRGSNMARRRPTQAPSPGAMEGCAGHPSIALQPELRLPEQGVSAAPGNAPDARPLGRSRADRTGLAG